jgi:hypothetical protein
LRVDQAAEEHIAFEYTDGRLNAEVLADNPPVFINGSPFGQGVLPSGTVLEFPQLRVTLRLEDVAVAAQSKVRGDGPRPIIIVPTGLAAIGCVIWILMQGKGEGVAAAPLELPELFTETTVSSTCPKATPEAALSLAYERMAVASGKRERHPFVPKDGPAAVSAYQQAAACFRAAGEKGEEKRASDYAVDLRRRISEDMRARSLRLENSMRVGDDESAKADCLVLMSLTEGKSGPYVSWLASVKRSLSQKKKGFW